MKIIDLKLNNKTYLAGKITAFLSKEALTIQRDSLQLAKLGQQLSENVEKQNIEEVQKMLELLQDIRTRKVWIICEVYENKFTADELEKGLSDEEIDLEMNKIIFGVIGIVQKN